MDKMQEFYTTVLADLEEIKEKVWGYDIPSPTVPEYREHHEQIQEILRLLKKKTDKYKSLYRLHGSERDS